MSVEAATGKRERTKQANRTAILDAGRTVFAQMGFGAASVRDIVRRTGLATGTFYNYFPDKESVLRALLEENANEARARVRAARHAATTVEDFVHQGFAAYFAFLIEDRETFELMRRNAGTIRALYDDPSIVAGFEELDEDLRGAIAGGLVRDHDTEYMSAAMIGTALEVAVRMLERDEPDPDAAARFVSALFLAALR